MSNIITATQLLQAKAETVSTTVTLKPREKVVNTTKVAKPEEFPTVGRKKELMAEDVLRLVDNVRRTGKQAYAKICTVPRETIIRMSLQELTELKDKLIKILNWVHSESVRALEEERYKKVEMLEGLATNETKTKVSALGSRKLSTKRT